MVCTETVAGDVYIRADDSSGRRSRASQITARKRSYESEHGVTLTLVSKSYSETYGFLSRSEFRYHSAPVFAGAGLTSPHDLDRDGFPVSAAYTVGILAAAARAGGHTGPRGFEANARFTAGGWVAYLESARMRDMTQGEAFSDDLPPGMLAEIRNLAAEHGRAAASWAFDGNTSRETYEAARKGIDEGDPLVLETFREPNLAGEYGDDYTERDLADDLGIESRSLDDHDVQAAQGLLDQAATEYEAIASDVYWAEIERMINVQLAPCGD